MKVRVQPADRGGCGFYRLRWPAAALQAQGADVEVHEQWPTALCQGQDVLGDRVVSVDVDCDVLVLQRPMEGKLLESFPALRRQGVAIVVEIDDDFHALPTGHPAKKDTAPIHHPEVNRKFLKRMCAEADLVTCSTQAIADRYAPHGRSVVIPNYVPAWYLLVEREPNRRKRIGWTGSVITHVNDLRACGDGVRIAMSLTGARFHVVGTGVGVAEQLDLREDITFTGWVEITDYPERYAELDVAIVPLQLNRFNEAKSYLKGLESAALGVPFVASPTTPYRELFDNGVGWLAESGNDWSSAIEMLLSNTAQRIEAIEAGRRFAEANTIEGNCWRHLEAWEQAVINARGKVAA